MLLLGACAGDGPEDPSEPDGQPDGQEDQDEDAAGSDPADEPDPTGRDDEDAADDDAPDDREPTDGTEDADEDTAAESDVERIAGELTDGRSEQQGRTGDDLRIVEVRVGAHDGFDRVTFELAGDGEAGWRIEPRDEPIAQGSGRTLDVAGTTALVVAIQPLPYPEDGELAAPDRVTGPPEATILTEVVQDSLFEGQHRFAIGLDGPAEYVVTRLEDPQRVVIDLVPAA